MLNNLGLSGAADSISKKKRKKKKRTLGSGMYFNAINGIVFGKSLMWLWFLKEPMLFIMVSVYKHKFTI